MSFDGDRYRVLNGLPMISNSRRVLKVVWLILAMVYAAPVLSIDKSLHAKAHIEYSREPKKMLISFREVFPEFADQDPTPLIRVYGDGRVAGPMVPRDRCYPGRC